MWKRYLNVHAYFRGGYFVVDVTGEQNTYLLLYTLCLDCLDLY